jgi:opacity protein-like surface antigen
LGVGVIHYPFIIGNANYFDIAPGGGVNYRLSRHWLLRAEYEYQLWINSPGYSNQPDHLLRPNGMNAGVAYRLFR